MQLIDARTDRGLGLTLPLAKGISRLILVFNALSRDWPLTREEASQEITEANQHFANINLQANVLSDDTFAALTDWRATMEELGTELHSQSNAEPEEPLIEATKALIRTRASEAWSILTLVDRELSGLPDDQTDPGRLP